MGTEFNGLYDSLLPNIYINGVTLENKLPPPSSNKDNVSPYIEEQGEDAKQYDESGDKLGITLNLSLNFPNVGKENFHKFILNDFLKNLKIVAAAFSGDLGKTVYKELIKESVEFDSFSLYAAEGESEKYFTDSISIKIIPIVVGEETLTNIDQLRQQLPDGTVVYKLPFKIELPLLSGSDPSDLSILAYCYETSGGLSTKLYGKIAKEIVIKNNKLQSKAMLFYISSNQEDENHEKEFGKSKGELWFGGVHKHTLENGTTRYMAGNFHHSQIHPYLDYTLVDTHRTQDFRLIAIAEKSLLNFEPVNSFVANHSFKDLRTNIQTVSLENLPIFSPLMPSVSRDKRIKLFFGIDYGKLIKRYSAVPAVMDKLDLKNIELERDKFNFSFLSFKIYRERQNVPTKLVSNKQLIYDGYPNVYYIKDKTNKIAASSLVPVELNTSLTNLSGIFRHYTFTDYEVNEIDAGLFKYSLEIEFIDPTVYVLRNQLATLRSALENIKGYLYDAQGGYFNSYTGQFDNSFISVAAARGFTNSSLEFNQMPLWVQNSFYVFNFLQINIVDGLRGMLKPESATLDSISAAYNIYVTVANSLSSFINSLSTAKIPKLYSTATANNAYAVTAYAPSMPQRKIKVEHTFENIINTLDFDAGYDFIGNTTPNSSPKDIGLKLISFGNYENRITSEFYKYFNPMLEMAPDVAFKPLFNNTPVPLAIPTPGDKRPTYLTVPEGETVLPKTIKDTNEENVFWQLIVNILRYKNNLLGNPNNLHRLGYGADDKIPGSKQITPKVERVLKDLQALSIKGAFLDYVSPDPSGQNDPQGNEGQETGGTVAAKVPWPNFKIEDFLLSLLNQNYFNLDLNDINLESFNPENNKSKITKYVYNKLWDVANAGLSVQDAMRNIYNSLPNQILALVFANTTPGVLAESGKKIYDPDSKSMFVNKFGEVWFSNQNIMQVEYLSGYQTYDMSTMTDLNSYEKTFNSAISAPTWSKLTTDTFNNVENSKGVLLCRLKRYTNTGLFNSKAYELLDLPVFDEHFFVSSSGLGTEHIYSFIPFEEWEQFPEITQINIDTVLIQGIKV